MPVSKEQMILRWDEFAGECLSNAATMIDEAEINIEGDPAPFAKLGIVALWYRTFSHLVGLRTMMKIGLRVEARILLRCCCENLFWVGGLAGNGGDFLKKIEADHVKSQKSLAHEMLLWGKKSGAAPEGLKKLEDVIDALRARTAKKIGHEQEATNAGLDAVYMLYRALSGDAAHPSAISISRHLRMDNGWSSFSVNAIELDTHEDLSTWDLSCRTFLLFCIVAAEPFEQHKSPALQKLFAKHARLVAENNIIVSAG